MVENCRPRRGSPAAGRCAGHGAVEFCVATRRGWRPLYIVSVIHLAGANAHQADHFSGGGDRRGQYRQHHMPGGADDHLMAPRRVRKPGVDQRETGDVFHLIQQIEATRDRKPAEGQGKEEGQEQRQPKTGIEKPTSATALIRVSGHLLRITPAIIPTGMPISRAKPKARMHSSMVAGNTSRNCSEISWPLMLETPKSQCSTLQTRTATHSTGKRPAVGHEGEIAQAETDKGQKKRVISSSSRRRRVKIIMASSPLRYFPRYASKRSVTERAEHQAFHIIAVGLQPQRRGQRQDRQFAGEDALRLFVSVHPRGELLREQRFCNTSSNSRLHQWAKLVCEAMAAQLSSGRKKLSGSLLSVAQPESVRSWLMSIRRLLETSLYRHNNHLNANLRHIRLDKLRRFQRAGIPRLRAGGHPQLGQVFQPRAFRRARASCGLYSVILASLS